jgi:hypothetical protein
MSIKAPTILALLAAASLASPAGAQTARREARSPLVVDRVDAAAGPLLVVEGPRQGQTVAGVVAVSGWVLSLHGIDNIELFIDDGSTPVNRAVLNGQRTDVLEAFPSYAAGGLGTATGWITSFLARNYFDGPHTLTLAVTESGAAAPALFGPINVVVDNSINQPPFGNIDVPPGGGTVLSAGGSLSILGWALDDSDVDHIDFQVDGVTVASAIGRGGVGNAYFGSTRPDIYAAFPDFPPPRPQSLYSGWVAVIDTTSFVDGMHTLSVTAWDDQGASNTLGTRRFQVENIGAVLGPFGVMDYPLDEATLICGPAVQVIPPGGPCPSPCVPNPGGLVPVSFFPNVIRGWALDVGARQDQGQVSYVELMLDGAILANSRTDCLVTGTYFSNCYGVNRPDVAHLYSGYVNAANAGFQFTFGLSHDPLLDVFDIFKPTPRGVELAGFTLPGKHTLQVRAGDEEETVTELDPISVDITCDVTSSNPDRNSFGDIDSPGAGQWIAGTFPVLGWAFDLDAAVTRVDVAVDGFVLASLTKANGGYGLRRDDVPLNDIRVTTPFVGFAYALDTTKLGDTHHDLTIYVFDSGGHRTLIGRREFVVFNNTPVKQ